MPPGSSSSGLAAFEAGREWPSAKSDQHGADERWIDWSPFSYPFNLTRQPAASMPCGLTAGGGSGGLPAGLQIVAPLYGDALVLRAARAYEQVAPIVTPTL